MTNLIEVPPDRDDEPDRRIPSWLWVIGGGMLVVILGAVLTFNASSDRTAAEETRNEAVALADEIALACERGVIPPEYAAACQRANQTRDEVERIEGERGPAGDTGRPGAVGPPGPPGLTGPPGPEGQSGATGGTGPAGSRGPAGSSGSDGARGSDGSRGPSGPSGPQGERGPTGPPGEQGPPGQFPASYTVQRPDGVVVTCNRNDAPPPDYICSVTS